MVVVLACILCSLDTLACPEAGWLVGCGSGLAVFFLAFRVVMRGCCCYTMHVVSCDERKSVGVRGGMVRCRKLQKIKLGHSFCAFFVMDAREEWIEGGPGGLGLSQGFGGTGKGDGGEGEGRGVRIWAPIMGLGGRERVVDRHIRTHIQSYLPT